MRHKRRKKKTGGSPAKKITVDGITFASGLEKYMYNALKQANLFDAYEGETFELQPAIQIPNQVFERMANGKGEFKLRSSSIRSISYTPDFTGTDYIIETKGHANMAFPLRYKMFKKWLHDNRDYRTLYKPQKHSECDEVVRLILNSRL